MKKQQFPKGWDEKRVKQLIAELDARTDEEWVAADEAAAADADDQTVITVPTAPAAQNPTAPHPTRALKARHRQLPPGADERRILNVPFSGL